MSTALNYDLNDNIATLTMDDGKANALNVTMLQAINEGLDRAVTDKAAVVVIQGREKMFSGGFDLSAFKREPAEIVAMLTAGAKLSERLLAFPVPVVAACTGHAVAMGSCMLLSGDVRIGPDSDARFHINEVLIGMILPHFAIEVSRQRLTPAAFTQAVNMAIPHSGQKAVAAGFLDEIVAPESVAEAARNRAVMLKSLNAGAYLATKLRSRKPVLDSMKKAIEQDCADWAEAFKTRG